jgi:Ca2+-binding RTX toxin-like protein
MSRILASAVVLIAGSLFSIGALSVEASAASSTASVTSGVLTFTAAGGQQNAIGITPGDAADSWLLSDGRPGNDITPGAGCTAVSLGDVECSGPISLFVIHTGDLDDQVLIGSFLTAPADVRAGSGNDTVVGSPAGGTILGGGGNDRLTGSHVSDQIHGGGGDDTISGLEGSDVLDGGKSRDTLNFAYSPTPASGITVTEDGTANDGLPGEGDNVSNVEIVNATTRADTVTLPKGQIYGGRDDDTLSLGSGGGTLWGQVGNDTLTAGAESSTLRGMDGNDTLDSVNGVADTDICNGGTDTVHADALDTVSADCENVTIS